MSEPFVSVIMPSYNTPSELLHEAVQSVLKQTYQNFELIIIDDGSAEAVALTIRDITDPRIRILRNPGNKDLPYTLNRGLDEAAGKYIFRMDSDDICKTTRLQKQVAFFEAHPEVDVVSTYARTFGACELQYRSSTEHKEILAELLWKNPIIHPTVALRAETVKKFHVRYTDEEVSEDYEIWSRLAFLNKCVFAVIPEELLLYRIHAGQITATRQAGLRASERSILQRSLLSLGALPEDTELEAYCKLRAGEKMSHQEISCSIAAMNNILCNAGGVVSKQVLKRLYRKALVKFCIKHKQFLELIQIFHIG